MAKKKSGPKKKPSVRSARAYDEAASLAALDQLDAVIGPSGVAGPRAARAAVPSPAQLCAVYGQARPLLVVALPLIARIPVYGAKIAGAIRLLMTIADSLCPGASAGG